MLLNQQCKIVSIPCKIPAMRNTYFSFLLLSVFSLVLIFAGCSPKQAVAPKPPVNTGATYSDVVYGSNTDWQGNKISLTMDIYEPANAQAGKKYPLVMHLHGGGFNDGDKTSAADKCVVLADSGFVAVTINYRIGWSGNSTDPCAGDTISFNEALYRSMQDVNAALRFLVSKADTYGIDTNWIFVSGASAGADAVLNAIYVNDAFAKVRYTEAAKTLGPLTTADNSLRNTYTIKGVCAIAGAIPDSNLINAKQAYPCISFQGEEDDVIPINYGTYLGCSTYAIQFGSLCQYRQLVANGKPAIANILPGAGHGNNGDSGYDNGFMMGNAACFFHKLMNSEQPSTGIYYGTINTCSN